METKKIIAGKKTKTLFSYYLPVLLWCAVIYFLSSIPSLKSGFPDTMDLVLRKAAHITEFATLFFITFRALRTKFGKKKAAFLSVLFSIVFALADEYHQTFVFGRNGSLRDAFIDSIGIFLACFLVDKKRRNVSIKK